MGNAIGKQDASGLSEEAAKIVLEAVQQKIRENVHRLSAECGGGRRLRSCHGTYLRAYDWNVKVDIKTGNPEAWENWYIEDWRENVALMVKAIHSRGRFLSVYEGSENVSLVQHDPKCCEMWKPFKNDNGSWSFLSVHGAWLSADINGRVYTVKKCSKWEQFWLE